MSDDLVLRILLQAQDAASATIKGLGASLKALNSGDVGNALKSVRTGVLDIAEAAVGVAAESTSMASDFQSAMLKVQALAGLTKQQTDDMSNSILQMAGQVGQSPKQLADGLYLLASAGYTGKSSLDMLKISAEAAATGHFDTKTAIDALTTSLKATNSPAEAANGVMDIMTKTVSQGKMEWANYAAVVGKVTLQGQAANVPFVQMNAALATLTNHGFPSVAQASTSLGNLFTQIGVKTDALEKHAKQLNISFDAQKFSTMDLAQKMDYLNTITDGNQASLLKLLGGSTTALKAFTALSGGMDDYNTNLKAIGASQGATAQAFGITQTGLSQQSADAKASLDSLMITLGNAFLPVLTQIVSQVGPMVISFMNWLNTSGTLKNVTAGLVGGLQTLVSVVANVVKFFQQNHAALVALQIVAVPLAGAIAGLVVAAFVAWAVAAWGAAAATLAATWPFLLIGAIIAAVIAGVILAIQHWGQIMAWIQGVLSAVGSFFVSLWGSIAAWFQSVWGGISSWFQGLLSGIASFFVGIWQSIVGFFVGLWQGAVSGVVNAWNAITGAINTAIHFVLNIVTSVFNAIGQAFVWLYNHNYFIKAMVDNIVSSFRTMVTFVTNVIRGLVVVWNWLLQQATTIFTNVSNAIHTAFTAAIGFIVAVWQTISGFFANAWNNWIVKPLTDVWNTVSGFFSNIWSNYIVAPLSSMWNNISSFFSNAWNNYIAKPVAGIWTSFSQDVSNAWQTVTTGFSDLWNSITGWAGGLANSALQWGANLINGFVNGIKNAVSGVATTLQNVASNIASFLGFHSPTKEGPGREADQWMPNLIKMLSSGLEAGVPQIQASVTRVARPMTLLSSPTTLVPGAGSAQGGTAAGGGTIYLTIQIDGRSAQTDRQLVDMIMQQMDRRLNRSGNLAPWISGGKA